jgi:hypothetical protein
MNYNVSVNILHIIMHVQKLHHCVEFQLTIFFYNGTYFGLRGRQDHVNMTWGDIQLKSTSGGQT